MTDEIPYIEIRDWKSGHIQDYYSESSLLNDFHDKTMSLVFKQAILRLGKGEPPCDFSWFIMGSGGRYEQGPISDQDHGVVYEISSPQNDQYFTELGKELSSGLNIVGYPYCQGNVMSSNHLWCKSLDRWRGQLLNWMEESSWEAIRNLQIFYDARALQGNKSFINELKDVIYHYQKSHPALLKRFMENVMHIKGAIGPFGQFIVEDYGMHGGMINLKYTAFLPYVNAVRLLAIKEGLHETSTIDRINRLVRINGYGPALRESKKHFLVLLKYRNSLYDAKTYDDTHYLNVKKLSREERKEIKKILKDGKRLHQYVSTIILR